MGPKKNPSLTTTTKKLPAFTTPVTKLSFHLPDQQFLVYNEDDPIEEVISKCSVSQSKFLAWIKANRKYSEARELTYVDFPTKFVWVLKTKEWKLRDRGFSIGRITYVPSYYVEAYYLRVLLNIVKRPRSFEEIRTVKGIVYPSIKDACYALDLVDDDKEYMEAIKESSLWVTEGYKTQGGLIMDCQRTLEDSAEASQSVGLKRNGDDFDRGHFVVEADGNPINSKTNKE